MGLPRSDRNGAVRPSKRHTNVTGVRQLPIRPLSGSHHLRIVTQTDACRRMVRNSVISRFRSLEADRRAYSHNWWPSIRFLRLRPETVQPTHGSFRRPDDQRCRQDRPAGSEGSCVISIYPAMPLSETDPSDPGSGCRLGSQSGLTNGAAETSGEAKTATVICLFRLHSGFERPPNIAQIMPGSTVVA
jgi:hypothetical protein